MRIGGIIENLFLQRNNCGEKCRKKILTKTNYSHKMNLGEYVKYGLELKNEIGRNIL